MPVTFNPFTGKLDIVSSGGGGGNPFDQSLNTTDSPTFSGLTVLDSTDSSQWNFGTNGVDPAALAFTDDGGVVQWSLGTSGLNINNTVSLNGADGSASFIGDNAVFANQDPNGDGSKILGGLTFNGHDEFATFSANIGLSTNYDNSIAIGSVHTNRIIGGPEGEGLGIDNTTGALLFYTYDSSTGYASVKSRIEADGGASFANGEATIGVDGSASFSNGAMTVNADGSITTAPQSAPSSPTAGMIYFDSTDSHFYGYNGTAWVQLDN